MTPTGLLHYRAYRHTGGAVKIAHGLLSTRRLLDSHEHVVLVEPSYVGICSADIREVRGERPGKRDFGHEVVGCVRESTHRQFAAGMPVVLNPFRKIDRETAFSELMYLAGSCDTLNEALLEAPDDRMEYSVIEPLACVIHAARQVQANRSEPVLISGAGFFGYLLYRYLELAGASVRLANRTPDRLDHLQQRAPDLAVARDLRRFEGRFATVFLMQTGLTNDDITATVPLLREGGEIVLFGKIAENERRDLAAIRSRQTRSLACHNGKSYYLQGTLDATLADMREALTTVQMRAFARSVTAILAPSLTFEQGASHLNHRAQSPRAFEKHVVGVRQSEARPIA